MRLAHPALLAGRAHDGVHTVARLRVPTRQGPVDGMIIAVPDLPGDLVTEQARALDLLERAGRLAVQQGATVVGLGSALAVVAGRGELLAERLDVPVTTGHASTAWACATIAARVSGDEPVGVLGFRGTVGDAVASTLAAHREVWVQARGPADARRAQELGVHAADEDTLLARCAVVVGAGTTGPTVQPQDLQPGCVFVDLANPPTLFAGARPTGVVELAGETLHWPGRVRGGPWAHLWRLVAGYEGGSAYACLAEPIAAAALGEPPWSAGRRLEPEQVQAAGQALHKAGFSVWVHRRRPPLTPR